MAVPYKPGIELNGDPRRKPFGDFIVYVCVSITFALLLFIGYITLRTAEDYLSDSRTVYFPCSHQSGDGVPMFNTWTQSRYCPPVFNIFFLKTHKCASSTVQNILMRYGDDRNLSFALPKASNYIGYPAIFDKSMVYQHSHLQHFDILCHHLRFNSKKVQQVMLPMTVYITILRNPVSLFSSMYDYYNMTDKFNKSIDDFIVDDFSKKKLDSYRVYDKLGRNQMFYDMGYDRETWENETLIRATISEMEKIFDLVLIQEYFDESLILLRNKLCWSMTDIIYLKHNMRTQSNSIKNGTTSLRIEKYNAADKMLYDHFLRLFNSKIDSFGRDKMAKEVQDLRLWNDVWFNHCIKRVANPGENVPFETQAYNSKVYSFVLKDEPVADICKRLAMEELQYTEYLRKKQKTLYGR